MRTFARSFLQTVSHWRHKLIKKELALGVACVQTSPLPQKKSPFFLREWRRLYTGYVGGGGSLLQLFGIWGVLGDPLIQTKSVVVTGLVPNFYNKLLTYSRSTPRRRRDENWPHKALIQVLRSPTFSRPVSLSGVVMCAIVGASRL